MKSAIITKQFFVFVRRNYDECENIIICHMYKLTTFRGKNSQTDSFRCSFSETIKKAKKQFFSFIHSLPTVTFVEKPNIGNVTLLILGVKQLQLLRIYFYSQLTLFTGWFNMQS